MHARLLAVVHPRRRALLYFLSGRATYTEHNGETIDRHARTVVHFPSGWTGRCDVHERCATPIS
jgi:uncharacterized cupin superfamily protein